MKMKILQGGVPKCGNFWLYQIIQKVLHQSGRETGSFIENHPVYPIARTWDLNYPDQAKIDVLEITDLQFSYRISSIFKMPILNLQKYIDQTTHVWTHSPVCQKSGEVFGLFDKKIYIIRDPRDRALSAARYYCSDYMLKYFPQRETDPGVFLRKNFDHLMHEWVWHVWDHLRLSAEHHIHVVFYENFLTDFPAELQGLLDYLEVDLDSYQKSALEKAVSFSHLKKRNPRHLSKGTAGGWKTALSEEQMEKAEKTAGPLIRFLNYSSGNPFFPSHAENTSSLYEKLRQEVIYSLNNMPLPYP